jgi:hypothetical protein
MSNDKFIIPSENARLESDLKTNKDKYMNHIYDSFRKNITKHDPTTLPPKLELFNFSETSLQVIIKKEHYKITLENLLDYYIKTEEYEKCNFIKNILINIKDYKPPTSEEPNT